MSESSTSSELTRLVVDHLARVAEANADTVDRVAALVADVGRSGHLLFGAGAGHSLGGVLEMFFRAGGLAFVSPVWHPRIFPLNGAGGSTAAEREPGLGTVAATASNMSEGDAVVIFSNSGINPYPVEIAEYARSVGVLVVAVTSRVASAEAPLRGPARLMDVADIVLDTLVPPGDVCWPPGDTAQVAPLSSLANVHLWNLVMATALDLDPDLPTWRSANTSGTDAPNEVLAARYGPRIPAM